MSGIAAFVQDGRLDMVATNGPGRIPLDMNFTDLIGGVSARGGNFYNRWAGRNFPLLRSGPVVFHYRVSGDIDVHVDALQLPPVPSLAMIARSASGPGAAMAIASP
ncbi:MAG: hypothetical protein ABI563_02885 [Specibacter sp.]